MSATDYDQIIFTRLTEIPPVDIINLMNDPIVQQHLPLAPEVFGNIECDRFIENKEKMWEENGWGPWAFVLDDEFIGWGGLQLEGNDVDIGLILNQKYWGAGPTLFRRILAYAFEELCVDSVTALLPPSRTRVSVMRRLGFRKDGEIVTQEQRFVRYRLNRSRLKI